MILKINWMSLCTSLIFNRQFVFVFICIFFFTSLSFSQTNDSLNATLRVGDIFISVDRIRENALKFSTAEADEMHRVIIHGALHLLGYKDKTAVTKQKMTQKEDFYLNKRGFNS